MINMVVYRVNKKPHPEVEHLQSRIIYGYSANVTIYGDTTIAIMVKEKLQRWDDEWTQNLKALKEYMVGYLDGYNVEWEIIDECRMD